MTKKTYPFYPSLPQAFGIFAMFLVFSIGVVLLLSVIFVAFDYENESLMNFAGYTISLAMLVWYARYKKLKLENDRPVFQFKKVPAHLYILLIFATLSLNIILEPLTNLIPLPDFMRELFMTLSKADIYTFLVLTVSAPILEEFLFRGIILKGFLRIYSPQKAIIWSSILFGFFHLNPWQFIPALFIGFVMGYIYWKTRSLLPCLFMHWLANSLGWYLGAYVDQEAMNFFELLDNSSLYYIIYGISIPILLGSLFLIKSVLHIRTAVSSTE